MRLYADSSKCCGCSACLVACSLNLFEENNPKKAALRVVPHFPEPGYYELKVCTQCGECAQVCPTGAIQRNDRGAYFVEAALCDLCGACETVCPEGVMFVVPEKSEHSWKCDLCGDCVQVCGMSALWIAEPSTQAA